MSDAMTDTAPSSDNTPSSGNATVAWALVGQMWAEAASILHGGESGDALERVERALRDATKPLDRIVWTGARHLVQLAKEGKLPERAFRDRRISAYIARAQRTALTCDERLKTFLQVCGDDRESPCFVHLRHERAEVTHVAEGIWILHDGSEHA